MWYGDHHINYHLFRVYDVPETLLSALKALYHLVFIKTQNTCYHLIFKKAKLGEKNPQYKKTHF